MSSNKNASMILGISMDQEICLIIGQVSVNLQYWKRPPDGYIWFWRRLTRKQLTSSLDYLWPELWKSMENNAKLKEKQKLSDEKFHFENARKLRGICCLDPEDKEFKETTKNARKNMKTLMVPALLCKTRQNCQRVVTSGKSNKIKSKFAFISEASESTRLRMEESLPNYHVDRIAGKGNKSQQHYNLFGSQVYSIASSYENSSSESSSGQGMGKIGESSGVEPDYVRSKIQVIDEARTSGAKFHIASSMDICHLKNATLQKTRFAV